MKTVIIVGGGSSVKEGLEHNLWEKIKGNTIISLNSVFKMMPYLPTIQIWVDKEFFRHDMDNLQQLHLQGVELVAKFHPWLKPYSNYIELWDTSREAVNYHGKDAFNKKIIFYGSMGLSGTFAISYSIAMGYDNIYLLGFDFGTNNLENKDTHWYQNQIALKNIYSTGASHPEVYLTPNGKVNRFIEDFKLFTKETDIKIWNVSVNSNIPYFPKISYKQFFERIKDERP